MAHLESEGLVLAKLLQKNPTAIAVDTEGTGLRVAGGTDKCIGISIACVIDGEAYSHYYPVGHLVGENYSKATLTALKKALTTEGHLLVLANAGYDLLSVETIDISLSDCDFIDILTMAHLINENFPRRKGLDELAAYYLKSEGKVKDEFLEKEKVTGWTNTTPEMIWDYAVTDAELTYRIWYLLKEHEHWKALPEGFWAEKAKLIRVLMAMQRRGVMIDQSLAQEYVDLGEAEMERLKRELGYQTIGPKALTDLFVDTFGFPVVKKTPAGKPSFDKEAMALYDVMLEREDRHEAKLIKEFRGWQKAVSAAYRPYLDKLDPDGRLRCSYKTHGTVTGRLSSSQPNLQQIPKASDKPWNGKVKECFIARPGYVLINADFSQLELRLATAYAGDDSLKEVFKTGRDIFTEMSEVLKGFSAIFDRQNTKTFVYSTQYGAGRTRLMNVFGVTERQAEQMLQDYYKAYPYFRKLNERCKRKVESDLRIRIWSGRERHFQYAKEGYKAMNSVIQGGAADIVERIMVRCYEELESDDCHMLLQVHDSITFEVKAELAEEYMPRIQSTMEDVNAVTGEVSFDVHFAVEVDFWTERERRIHAELTGKEAA